MFRIGLNRNTIGYKISLDEIDLEIISHLAAGYDNRMIAKKLKIAFSTIQRRSRNIMLSGIIKVRLEPNYKRLGFQKGLLHAYLHNGNFKKITSEVAKMDGILSTSVHVGNSDIVGEFIYKDSQQLVDTISNIKQIDGVKGVLWSEEVYSVRVNPKNILNSFRNLWNKNRYR